MSVSDPDIARASAGLPGRLVASLAFGTVLQALNSTMIAVALVDIRKDFHAGQSASWLVTALYLTTAVAAPVMGRVADSFGAKKVCLSGLCFVIMSSTAAPFMPNIGALIACRVFLGIGTAAQYPCAVAVIRRVTEERQARPQSALGILATCSQVIGALGPTVGGIMVDLFHWPGIFLVNSPLALIAGSAVLTSVPTDPEPDTHGATDRGRFATARFDVAGLLLFATALTFLLLFLFSLAQTPQFWWLGIALLCALALVFQELQSAAPFLEFSLLRNWSLTATYLRTIVTYTAFYCVFYGLPQWLEEARDFRPSQVGLVLVPITAMGIVTTAVATYLENRRGPRITLIIGTAAMAIGGLLLAMSNRASPLWLLLGTCAVLGLPDGFNNIGNQMSMYSAAPTSQVGGASGLYRTCQSLGAIFATVFLAFLMRGPSTDEALHRVGFLVCGLSILLLVAALLKGRPAESRSL
ncbi:MFS transporter [Streptomyces hokutonensis]|uniref:MFS transporter n=1 Tax=Streptomyces hokutonensis TaxID=1306990 RepID=A0ABW6MQ73_9ACTN